MTAKLILGCGYLGRRVAALWQAQGHPVVAATRSAARAAEFRSQGIEPVVCDVVQPDSLRALPAVDTLLYCVGMDRAAGHSMHRVYVEGLANVLAALTASHRLPARFLYVSSTSVYGQTDGAVVDETAPTEPLEESGRIVLAAERTLRERLPSALILRFAGIYGPDRLLRAKAIRAGEPFAGDAEKWLNLIQVADGATAVVAAAERGRDGAIYNVSDGHPVRRRDFYEELARLLNAPAPRFAPPAADAADTVNRRIDNRLLREELGVVPRYASYVEGLTAAFSSREEQK